MTPKDRAIKAGHAMWASDNATKWIGMTLDDVDEGCATLSLIVTPHHCNGHGMCHGGIIFALADSAFAFACNSRNQATVAQHNTINFIAPAQVGDHLRATATEVSLTGRSGIYDVRVIDQNGTQIAEMRGMSRSVRGQVFPEPPKDT